MKLSNPMMITTRLLPGMKIGQTFLSIDYDGYSRDGRVKYRVFFDPTGEDKKLLKKSICVPGFESPAIFRDQDDLILEQAKAVLSFLAAFAEASRYGSKSENYDLFPDDLREWAVNYSDEIDMLGCEIGGVE